MEPVSSLLALVLVCVFSKCLLEQVQIACNVTRPFVLVLSMCSQLLSHLVVFGERISCTVSLVPTFPKSPPWFLNEKTKMSEVRALFREPLKSDPHPSNGYVTYLWLLKTSSQNPFYRWTTALFTSTNSAAILPAEGDACGGFLQDWRLATQPRWPLWPTSVTYLQPASEWWASHGPEHRRQGQAPCTQILAPPTCTCISVSVYLSILHSTTVPSRTGVITVPATWICCEI